jgi:hypothetical protein
MDSGIEVFMQFFLLIEPMNQQKKAGSGVNYAKVISIRDKKNSVNR